MQANLLDIVVQSLIYTLQGYYIIVIIAMVLSWVRVSPYSSFYPVARFFYMVTEPALAPIRSFVPPLMGLDFSPVVLIIILRLLQALLASLVR